jgi:two-component system LytT family response regulator
MGIRAVIADDEVLARQKLRVLLTGEKDLELVGEGTTARETIDLVHLTRPDLLFLDIQMPGMDGLDVVSALSLDAELCLPSIIFTTAYDQYALRAFEINAVDYLLKPFTHERLSRAIERARTTISQLRETGNSKADEGQNHYTRRMVFKSRGRILFLPVEDIRWVGAEENYVRISTEKESHLLRETMARLELRLNPEFFIRVHRSTIVNLHYVKEIRTESQEGDSFVLMTDGQKLPVSRGYRARMSQLMSR